MKIYLCKIKRQGYESPTLAVLIKEKLKAIFLDKRYWRNIDVYDPTLYYIKNLLWLAWWWQNIEQKDILTILWTIDIDDKTLKDYTGSS